MPPAPLRFALLPVVCSLSLSITPPVYATAYAPPEASVVAPVPGEHRKSAYAAPEDDSMSDAAADTETAPAEETPAAARPATPRQPAIPVQTNSAQPSDDSESATQSFERQLHFRSGTITLSNQLVKLELGDKYRYLDAADARKVIVDLWGNPPDSAAEVLGMIVPANSHFDEADFWGAVIQYKEDGHVSDEDARDINYDQLLQQMKQASDEDDKRRRAAGYEGMALIGWAVPPHYDAGRHVMHWAKEFKGDKGDKVMNYDVRVLGRKGVLSLLVVADPQQIDSLREAINDLPQVAQYTSGNRYADFDKSNDKMASYGLAALVAGGTAAAAAKAGKLALLAVFLKKGWVLLLAGLVAMRNFFARLFGGGKSS